ncbi:hypothetical protein [Microvirga rosea]|uniref:hypothetical protein n=1 Tax=Microvirga rosea TaxID=2715425 RepID=UPI001D0A4E53|nr:hypothetical protein [Microvirga rosea]MCB8820443.1 hypothetical protein [Microvirga rosea]
MPFFPHVFPSIIFEVFIMSRVQRILAHLPDADDALRRLADVIQIPETCRRRTCRTQRRCRGGYGPPCYFENRQRFADAVLEEMDDHREVWLKERTTIAALLRSCP